MRAIAVLFTCCLTTVTWAAEPPPVDIVTAADQIRFPNESFQVSVHVTTIAPNRDPELHEYQVLQDGHDKSVVRTLAPASEAGQVMLLRGPDLWVFLPEVSQPVRLPLSQRLTGQVANGDLARANFAGDYKPTLLREEKLKDKSCYVLELIAARKGVTYHRVIYWVETKTHRPVKAEFYTLSKRLMKTGLYSDFKDLGGAIRPTKLTLQDALKKGEESVLVYSGLKTRAIPDKFFTKDFLRKLKS
jgi:outer membrane lipoprotein-sorting protein